MAWDHRSLEGALYGLGRPPEAAPSSPRPVLVRIPIDRGPRPLEPSLARRIDVGLAVQHSHLPAEDKRVLLEHYITGSRRYSYRRRKPIIGALLLTLNDLTVD